MQVRPADNLKNQQTISKIIGLLILLLHLLGTPYPFIYEYFDLVLNSQKSS
jgi:hypothetical protein